MSLNFSPLELHKALWGGTPCGGKACMRRGETAPKPSARGACITSESCAFPTATKDTPAQLSLTGRLGRKLVPTVSELYRESSMIFNTQVGLTPNSVTLMKKKKKQQGLAPAVLPERARHALVCPV